MLNTHKAVLRGNRLEWSDRVPDDLAEDRSLQVSVTTLRAGTSQGRRIAAALEVLARLNAAGTIADPAAWEREQR
jgi:hypothetical protein